MMMISRHKQTNICTNMCIYYEYVCACVSNRATIRIYFSFYRPRSALFSCYRGYKC